MTSNINVKAGLIVLAVTSTFLFIFLIALIFGLNSIHTPILFVHQNGPLVVKNGAVSSGSSFCNKLGVDVLIDGGNSVDASITTALCLGVQNMFASGIGGGGVMIIHRENEVPFSVDCRETAPFSATPDMFVQDPIKSKLGGMAVGIPGELMCMDYSFRNFGSGKVTWKRLFDPVIKMTKYGFAVDELMENALIAKKDLIFKDNELKKYFTKDNKLFVKGDIVKMEILSKTLFTISNEGIQAFYNGSLTSKFVDEINSQGGNVSIKDFNDYDIRLPGIYSSKYRNYTVYTPKLPFSGGLMLIQSLNILEHYNLDEREYNADTIHLLIETMKFAFSNRLVLGDPEYTDLPKVESAMLSKEHSLLLKNKIDFKRTHIPSYYLDLAKNEADILAPRGHGTEHISIIDSNRTAVAFTTSVNLGWGAGFIGPQTGILWNNQMDDFNIPPQENTSLPSYSVNYPGPKKRPLSSMTPTFIYDNLNKLFMVTGGSGGPKIFTGTLLNIILTLDFKQNLKEATYFSRYHHQLKPDTVTVEGSLPNNTIKNLSNRGHKFFVEDRFNIINSVQVHYKNNFSLLHAESDWRKFAKSAGH